MVTVSENIFIIDPQFIVRKTSARLRSRLGAQSDKELVGQKCYELFFNTGLPCSNCPVLRSVAFKTTIEEEIPNNSHTKRVVKATPVLNDEQHVTSVIVDCIDDSTIIATRKAPPVDALIDALPKPEQSNNQPYRAVLIDGEFNILLLSNSMQPLVRGFQGSGIGQNLFSALPQYSPAPVREQLERFVADEYRETLTFTSRSDFYSEEWIEHTLVRLSMRGKTGAIVILSSPQKHPAEQEKQHAQKGRMSMLSEFASNVAHDFRNYLAPITNDIEFLKSDMIGSGSVEGMFKSLEHIEKIKDRIQEMLDVLDTLHAFKPLKPTNIAEIDVGQMVNRAATMVKVGKPFLENDITVTVGQDLPFLYGVEEKLERALIELFRALLIAAGDRSKLRVSTHFIHDKKGQFIIKIRVNASIALFADLDTLLQEFIRARGRMQKTHISFLTVYATVLDHDGSMELIRLTDEETEVLLKLPRMMKY